MIYISNFERPKSESNISRGEFDYFIKTNKKVYPFTNTASECWNLKNIFYGTRTVAKTRFEALATLDSKRVR